jgi:hypothetical protein
MNTDTESDYRIHVSQELVIQLFESLVRSRLYKEATNILAQIKQNTLLHDTAPSDKKSDLDLENNIKNLMQKYDKEWQELLKIMLESAEKMLKQTQKPSRDTEKSDSLDAIKQQQEMCLLLYRELLNSQVRLSPKVIALIIRVYHSRKDLIGGIKAWTVYHNSLGDHVDTKRSRKSRTKAKNANAKSQIESIDSGVLESLLHITHDLGSTQTWNVIVRMYHEQSQHDPKPKRKNAEMTARWKLTNQSIEYLLRIMGKTGDVRSIIRLLIDLRNSK